jgi:hypothetical protein
MANLTITASVVRPVVVIDQLTGPVNTAVSIGQVVKINTTTGYFEPALATTAPNARACGVVTSIMNGGTAAAANQTVTVVRKGLVDIGSAMTAVAFNADIFLSDTSGTLADTAGTSSKVIGTVVPGFSATSADKLLRIDL